MSTSAKPVVPWGLRLGIGLLTIVLTLLLIWLLGFLLDDIGRIQGPDRAEIDSRHLDRALLDRSGELSAEIAQLERRSGRQKEIQKERRESMTNARGTMEQMLELQRLALQQNAPPSEAEKEALALAQKRFLEAQERFESANAEISSASEKRFELEREQATVNQQIEEQRKPAQKEYDKARKRHNNRLAGIKLALIVPLFLLAAFLLVKFRGSPFRPLFLALLGAAGWKLFLVMFGHFPKEYFKYIAILAGIGTVIWFLRWLIGKATRPSTDIQLKRNREGYQRHRCPVCAYPILRGPFKSAAWTRKGPVFFKTLSEGSGAPDEDAPYDCPSCGTNLFEKCGSCGETRHTLLPFCSSCGTADGGEEPTAE